MVGLINYKNTQIKNNNNNKPLQRPKRKSSKRILNKLPRLYFKPYLFFIISMHFINYYIKIKK